MTKKISKLIKSANTQKTIKIMKLITLFIVIGISMTYAGNSYAQVTTLSLKANDKTVREVLNEIEKNSEYVFLYNRDTLDTTRKVSISAEEETIIEILDKLFANTDNTYKVSDRQIYISKIEHREEIVAVKESKQKRAITGIVLDQHGESIIGANVIEVGTTNGTVTDIDGRFTLQVENNAIIQITYLGYLEQKIDTRNKNTFDVVLLEDTQALDEVVVVGYGAQKKTSVVSSVSTVKGSQLNVSSRSLTNNISGQVAGLIAIQRSGEPGYDNSEFWIRGVSTFAGGSSPLVLVDGVPRNINDIEPDEIESFTVLKDAAATAVYGAEGANGVVIITSKRGHALKPVITFRTEHSLSEPTRLPKFVGSAQYLSLFNEALINDGELPIYNEELIGKYRDNVDPDLYPSTDWLDAMLKPTTHNHRYTLNVRGGTDKARYFVSGAYFSETGIFKNDPNNRYETSI